MENRARIVNDCNGQSVAEYAVVLALIVIIAVTVLMGIGQRSRARLVNVDTVLDGHLGAPSASATVATVDTSGRHSGGDQGSESSSGSNQARKVSVDQH